MVGILRDPHFPHTKTCASINLRSFRISYPSDIISFRISYPFGYAALHHALDAVTYTDENIEGRQTDRQAGRQADRQTDRQTVPKINWIAAVALS